MLKWCLTGLFCDSTVNKLTVGFITTLSERLQLIVQLRLRYTCFISCGLICPLLLLTNILIIFLQDEVSAQIPGAFDNPNNAVRIHHSLASIASDYRFEITANNTSLSADVKFVVLPSFYVFFAFQKKGVRVPVANRGPGGVPLSNQ